MYWSESMGQFFMYKPVSCKMGNLKCPWKTLWTLQELVSLCFSICWDARICRFEVEIKMRWKVWVDSSETGAQVLIPCTGCKCNQRKKLLMHARGALSGYGKIYFMKHRYPKMCMKNHLDTEFGAEFLQICNKINFYNQMTWKCLWIQSLPACTKPCKFGPDQAMNLVFASGPG